MQARPLITEDSALLAAEQTLAAAMETGQGLDEMIPEAALLTESLVSSIVPGDSRCLTVEKQIFCFWGAPRRQFPKVLTSAKCLSSLLPFFCITLLLFFNSKNFLE